jgi:hypothetical protein
MENNKHIFIMADADALLKALRAQIRWAGPGWAGLGAASCEQLSSPATSQHSPASQSHQITPPGRLTACLRLLPRSAGGLQEGLRSALAAAGATLSSEAMSGALASCGLKFTAHQMVALSRRLDKERCGKVKADDLLAALGL